MQMDSENPAVFALTPRSVLSRFFDWLRPNRGQRVHNAKRLEKQLKDFAGGGLALFWQRQGIYLGAALLSGFYFNPWVALICFAICQFTEMLDTYFSLQVVRWKGARLREARRYLRLMLLSSTLSSLAVGLFALLVAQMEGPYGHFTSLFFLFAAGLFAAVNNHQLPQVLLVRLFIYGAVFLYIPLIDLWILRPSLDSKLWLQFATVVFVLFFVLECSMIFLRLYRSALDQLEELRLERDKAREAYELKSQFVSTVSHELRTPLTSIIGSLGLLRQPGVVEDPVRSAKILDIGHKNSQRLSALINDLLDLQKLEAGQMSYHLGPVSLEEVIQDAVDAMEPYADDFDITLSILPNADEVIIHADNDRMHQVIDNLLSNAIKFSPKGQRVEIGFACHDDVGLLTVRDFGIGIPDDSRDIVFGQFRQIDSSDHRSFDGTGLGLSITEQIVTAMGGRIDYESTLGEGTIFTVEIPLN